MLPDAQPLAVGPAPFLTLRGALWALALALVLGWPMLAMGGYLIFDDTEPYIRGGRIIWQMALDMVLPTADPGAAAGGANGPPAMTNDRGEAYSVRSFIYSLYTLFAGAAVWPAGFALLQAAMVLWMLAGLIGPAAVARPGILAAGFVWLAALTTLPWFAAYLMPDLLAAAIVIYGAILIRRFDALSVPQRIALGLLAAFAVAAHYGHPPLAAGVFGSALLWRLATRRLTWAVCTAAILPVLFAPLANLGASTVALDTPSVAPLRLPILLARSIQDGPARWYLEEACPEAPLAFCEAFGDDVPTNIPAFLWDKDGIDSLTPEQMARIRAEEATVLVRAFARYPVAQTRSLIGNALKQAAMVGTGQIEAGHRAPDGDLEPGGAPRAGPVLAAFDRIVPVGTWAGAAALAVLLLSGRLGRDEREVLAMVVLGLVINAAIFGGLSAPVDRYQSRVIWLLPALAAIFVAGLPRRGG